MRLVALPCLLVLAGPAAASPLALTEVPVQLDVRPGRGKGEPRPVPAAATASGPFAMETDAVSLLLDAFGGFGASTAGGDATFRADGQEAETVFEYLTHVRGVGFLESDWLVRSPSAAGASWDGSAVVASYRLGAFAFTLRTELIPCGDECAELVQDWTIRNVTTVPKDLLVTLYLDGDLFFSGQFNNDFGVLGESLYQFDDGSDPHEPSTYLGLESTAPEALVIAREVGEFANQRVRIVRGEMVAERLVRASGATADADGDGITDVGFDVSVAVGHDFGSLAPGRSVSLQARLRWGMKPIVQDEAALVADAGDDLILECEGRDGVVAILPGAASGPEPVVAWSWLVDGMPAGDAQDLDVVLAPGSHGVELHVTDARGQTASDSAIVEVVDGTAPVIDVLAPVVLWPPDHRLVEVSPPVRFSDGCAADEALVLRILSVESSDPADGRGDGRTSPDVVVTGDGRLLLRRERSGTAPRTYTITGEVLDTAGNAAPFTATAVVPHDARRGGSPLRPALRPR